MKCNIEMFTGRDVHQYMSRDTEIDIVQRDVQSDVPDQS